jgi:hypothetical protein
MMRGMRISYGAQNKNNPMVIYPFIVGLFSFRERDIQEIRMAIR